MKRKLQIFVSSTFTDLIAERQAAVSAILKAGHIPAGMELFTAGDKSQMDTIKKWIDESDAYMLILGGRYGSIEPATGVSYTELEYNYATEQKKPLFATVITDQALEVKIRENGSAFLEKENPQELKLFRSKVLSNISSFFDDDKDIRLTVHESLSELSSNTELKGWIQADEIVDTKHLFEEIRKLAEENQKLKETLATLEKRPSSQKTSTNESFEELLDILSSIEIKIPAKINNNKDRTSNLFDIFVTSREYIINGVTDAATGNDLEGFFFFNICPKLQVHGLVEIEKVTGVRWRRYTITKSGISFLAEYDRRALRLKKQKEQADAGKSIKSAAVAQPPITTNATKKSSNGTAPE